MGGEAIRVTRDLWDLLDAAHHALGPTCAVVALFIMLLFGSMVAMQSVLLPLALFAVAATAALVLWMFTALDYTYVIALFIIFFLLGLIKALHSFQQQIQRQRQQQQQQQQQDTPTGYDDPTWTTPGQV